MVLGSNSGILLGSKCALIATNVHPVQRVAQEALHGHPSSVGGPAVFRHHLLPRRRHHPLAGLYGPPGRPAFLRASPGAGGHLVQFRLGPATRYPLRRPWPVGTCRLWPLSRSWWHAIGDQFTSWAQRTTWDQHGRWRKPFSRASGRITWAQPPLLGHAFDLGRRSIGH